MAPQRLLLFGDHAVEKLPSIRNLVRISRTSPSIRRFLREATDIVQTEVTNLTSDGCNAFCTFDNLLALAEENAKHAYPDPTVAASLMAIAQMGELIAHFENDPSIFGSLGSTVHILGLCTGLLPAAAAAVARDTSELITFGLEIVAVSFRLAHELALRSRRIEETPGSWGCTIMGVTGEKLQAILDQFHQAQKLPIHRYVYQGVVSSKWTTLFGPPSTLAQLWEHSELGLLPKLPLGVSVAVHADHLPLLNMERVLGSSKLLNTAIVSRACIMSTSTCVPFIASNLRTLIHQMLEDVAQNTLRITDTVQAIVSDLKGGQGTDLIVVGPTTHTVLIQGALEDAHIKVNLLSHVGRTSPTHKLRGGSDDIAIVGMSGRFPGSESVKEFWETLQKGQDFHRKVPESRFNISTHFDPDANLKNSLTTQYGCFLDRPGLFDNRLFNVSPREAAQMDPLQRLLLMVSYEAMEMAGYAQDGSLSTNSKRIATYMGQAADDWRSINECQGIDIYYIPSVSRAFTSGRLNYHFKWEGASYTLDSACASSSTAIALACSALIARDCDTALAGGGSILPTPALYAGLSRGGFLSTSGGCKTYHDDADGYCRGEGVGVVVLKRLEDAISDNDNIQAVIKGYARTYSADAKSITQPHKESQCKLYNRVLQQTCTDPLDIGYVEMHGTATQLGDVSEMTSVAEVFGEGRTKDNPLVVGAVKANVGHGEAAAGVTSLIKTLMMFRESSIPPQPGIPFEVNHNFPSLETMNIKISDKSMPFKARQKVDSKRKLLLNNFDASGGNTCLLLEDPPERPQKGQDPRTYHVVTCSGRTAYSLMENKQRLVQFLISHPETKLSDLAYTTTARRLHDTLKSSYPVQTTEELVKLITADLTGNSDAKTRRTGGRSSVVFAFTGQGSLNPGAGKKLFETCPSFRESIVLFQKICDSQGLPAVVDLIVDKDVEMKSKTTVEIQLAIVMIELALAHLWKSWGVQPDLLIGHSLGEYIALCISGVLSVSDTLYLVGQRSMMMQKHCALGSNAMLAIGMSSTAARDTLASQRFPSCHISCINAPNSTVVSGKVEDLKYLQNHLQTTGTNTTFLHVPYGLHSPQVDPILEDFEASARGIHFAKPLVPMASTLTGTIVSETGTFTPHYLARQAREPVDFVKALQSCKAKVNEQTLWIEIGPSPVCLGLVRSTLNVPSTQLLPSVKHNEDNWKTIASSIASAYTSNVALNWPEYHKPYVNCLTLLEVPTYAFDMKDYWFPYDQEALIPKSSRHAIESTITPSKPILTSCLQYVERETILNDRISVTFLSNTSEPSLFDAIQGHTVDDIAICPASVFSDMAYTAAKYIYQKAKSKELVQDMSLVALKILHPLVVNAKNPQQLIMVTAVSSGGSDLSVNVSFKLKEGPSSQDLGACQVQFGKNDARNPEFSRSLHLVQKRMNGLVDSAITGLSHRLLKPIVYKLFANLVRYDEKYQGIEEVCLDYSYDEAVATVKLRPSPSNSKFTCSPYWIDAIIHLAGFVLNGNVTNAYDVAYISTGFESLRIAGDLSEGKTYKSYVSIQATEKQGILLGDVYVFEDDRLVATCFGLLFQKLTRKVLGTILGKDSTKASQRTASYSESASTKTASHMQIGEIRDKGDSLDSETNSLLSSRGPSSRTSLSEQDESDIADVLLATVASETGFEIGSMEPDSRFSDMGVDSLMSISIIAAVKKQIGISLAASFFVDHPTVSDVMNEFGKAAPPTEIPAEINSTSLSIPTQSAPLLNGELGFTPMEDISEKQKEGDSLVTNRISPAQSPNKPISQYFSNVVLIRGRASSSETPLFLVADGAGSGTAYIHLPPFPAGNRIYALESPFLAEPSEYKCSAEDAARIYLAALRKTQPHGPYIIGGWSAGAVFAYEVSRMLLEQNEQVLGLFIIDMHIPRPMPEGLKPTMDLIDGAGLITGIQRNGPADALVFEKLKLHLLNTVQVLSAFSPKPMHHSRRPLKTFAVWAQLGLSETSPELLKVQNGHLKTGKSAGSMTEEAETDLKAWFYAKRSSFGPNGWDKLAGDVECHVMDNVDHFSMVRPPHARVLGQILAKAISKCAAP